MSLASRMFTRNWKKPPASGGYGTLTIWLVPSSASTVGAVTLSAHVVRSALNRGV